jgi:DNA-directed RNA polymerase specialized sigma24 family protein
LAQLRGLDTALTLLGSRRSRRYPAQIWEEALAVAEYRAKIHILSRRADGMGTEDWVKWLARVASRAAVDQVRCMNPVRVATRRAASDRLEPCKPRRRGHPLVPLPADDTLETRQTASLDPDEIALIWEAMSGLPGLLAYIMLACDIEGMSQKEAARALGTTQPVVNHGLRQARRRLREILAGKVG